MAVDAGLVAWIEEALEPMGTLSKRAMMGGLTLYLDGQVFAVVDSDALYFKSDAVSDPEWEAAGCAKFSFTASDGSIATMNYRRAPDDVYDDADAMRRWARLGLEAGLRAPRRAKGESKRGEPRAGSLPSRS